MTRKRTLELGVINITMSAPHLPERYVALFKEAFSQNKKTELRGDYIGLLGELKIEDNPDKSELVRGEFFKYMELDVTKEWFSIQKRKRADKEDLDAISIPDDLKPHFQFFPFVFFPNGHRLVLVCKDSKESLPPKQAAKILSTIFNCNSIQDKFGRIDVVVEPSRETLDKIFSSSRLRTLVIEVTPPNADDFHEFEEELFKNMDSQNTRSYNITLQEADDRGLLPSEQIKKLAQIAQSNGKVVGQIGSRGKNQTLSTEDHPLLDKVEYLPDTQIRSEVLFSKAIELISNLKFKK